MYYDVYVLYKDTPELGHLFNQDTDVGPIYTYIHVYKYYPWNVNATNFSSSKGVRNREVPLYV